MIQPTTVQVGEVNFHILPFDPFRALELFGDLQVNILPAVGGVMAAALDKESERDETAVIGAFRDLCMKFDGKTLKAWADKLLSQDHISFEPVDGGHEPRKLTVSARAEAFDDFSHVLELMYHVGKVNFAVPLARWAGLSGLAQPLREKLLESFGKTSSPNS